MDNIHSKEKTEWYVQTFVQLVKIKYPDLHIDYKYDTETDTFEIWHDNNEIFLKHECVCFISQWMRYILLDNDVYNFALMYDYVEATKMVK